MVTTNYPYIIPEGVVWSARTGRLMTVAEAAAELEAQAGGGGGGISLGAVASVPDGTNFPAGTFIALWPSAFPLGTNTTTTLMVYGGLVEGSNGSNIQNATGQAVDIIPVTFT